MYMSRRRRTRGAASCIARTTDDAGTGDTKVYGVGGSAEIEGWASRRGHFKISADLASEKVVDLAMPRHRGRLTSSAIYENRVTAAFAQEHTTIPFEMTN